jgi:hypothetical protein
MQNTVSFATEPKYLMDRENFYWNPLCPENQLRLSLECTLKEISNIRIPVRIFRNGQLVKPSENLPEDIAANTKPLEG